MLTKMDKSKLSALYRSDIFSVLRQLAQEIIEELHKDVPTGETEFQYLKNSLERDGQIIGIDKFIKQIEKYANPTDRG